MSSTIRTAVEADLRAIVAIYNEAVPGRTATADTSPVTVEDRIGWFRAHNPSTHPIFVCEDAGWIVGWSSLSPFYGRPAYSRTVEVSTYVTTGRHRSGIGTALRSHVLSACPHYRIQTVLSFVFGHNTAGIRLNEKFGVATWGHLPRVAVLDGYREGFDYYGETHRRRC